MFPDLEFPVYEATYDNDKFNETELILKDDLEIFGDYSRKTFFGDNGKIIGQKYYNGNMIDKISEFIYNDDGELLYEKIKNDDKSQVIYRSKIDESNTLIGEELIIDIYDIYGGANELTFTFIQFFKSGYIKIKSDLLEFKVNGRYYKVEIPYIRGIKTNDILNCMQLLDIEYIDELK